MNALISINARRALTQSLKLTSRTSSSSIIGGMNVNARMFSSLPYHVVAGMPALSPTMEAGSISKWNVGEGEAFAAGDSLAEIETDKATMDFEAQDDGVVARILVQAGGGEVTVGEPIMVTVEEEEDVAAFKDFVAPAADTPAAEEKVVEEVKPVEVAPPTPAPVVAAPAAPVAPPTPAPVVAAVPEPVAVVAAASDADAVESSVSPAWGNFAKVKSPLASTLSASQKKYIEMYGSTGQVPI